MRRRANRVRDERFEEISELPGSLFKHNPEGDGDGDGGTIPDKAHAVAAQAHNSMVVGETLVVHVYQPPLRFIPPTSRPTNDHDFIIAACYNESFPAELSADHTTPTRGVTTTANCRGG